MVTRKIAWSIIRTLKKWWTRSGHYVRSQSVPGCWAAGVLPVSATNPGILMLTGFAPYYTDLLSKRHEFPLIRPADTFSPHWPGGVAANTPRGWGRRPG